MSRFFFHYGVRFRENGQIEIFPAVEIFILGRKKGGIRALFHLDSGATTTILPEHDAEILGINIKVGKKVLVRGISGETLTGYRHLIDFKFNGKKMKIPAIFIERVLVPRILGREGIFPRFGILFDEMKQRTAFLEAKKERKIIDSLFEKKNKNYV